MAKEMKAALLCPHDDGPTLYLELRPEDVKGLLVGDKITLAIQGKVSGVSQRESFSKEGKVVGSLDLKDYQVKVTKPSEFEDLMDEEE